MSDPRRETLIVSAHIGTCDFQFPALISEKFMKRRFNPTASLLAVSLVTGASFAYAQTKPPESAPKEAAPMHMHKSDMAHGAAKSDAEQATAFKGEATELRMKAASHRKLAANYRGGGGGKSDRSQAAKHCDNLAKLYEDAAKEADLASARLGS